jgi:hypothetical protein
MGKPDTPADRAIIDRAREVLQEESPSMYELGDMAERIGRLEWHLGEMIRLAGRAAG